MVFLSKKETYRLMNLSEKEIDRIIEMAWEDCIYGVSFFIVYYVLTQQLPIH